MFVIYHIRSTMQVGPTPNGRPHSGYAKRYKSYGAALRTMAKFNAQEAPDLIGPGPYGAAHVDHYRARVVRKVERVNLMSGQTYLEDSNTPGYMSPSSEAYWSS